ncbi:MAG: hypothetical protein GY804_05795 [Alphaproteobacteria bacterium]|nr:hypothetical protein [Alphaproteobacteria bacterium]
MKRLLSMVLVVSLFVVSSNANAFSFIKKDQKKFGIYTSTLDGKDLKLLISDPDRELAYARVSPNKKMITFTRFNKKAMISRRAEEKGSNYGSEIMIAKIDGTNVESLTPPNVRSVNMNGTWTPDGKSIVYMANDDFDKERLVIKQINLETRKIRTITPHAFYSVGAPQQVKGSMVYSVEKDKGDINTVWLQNLKTEQANRVTMPPIPRATISVKEPAAGDGFPRLSSDGTKIAFTRHRGNGKFQLLVRDLKSGNEKVYSKQRAVDVMPEWSSDGEQLIYWRADDEADCNVGVYLVSIKNRKSQKLALPDGYFYKMPSFFPGEGSDTKTRIIFSAKKIP